MVKHIITILLLLVCSLTIMGQTKLDKGIVSFVTTKKVYVKFNSTANINVGDTLFLNQNNQILPVLVVENKSSSSTVCIPLGGKIFKANEEVFAQIKPKETNQEEAVQEIGPPASEQAITTTNDPVVKPDEDVDLQEEVLFKEKIKGRISVASYNNLSNYKDITRMRYAFSFRGYNLKNSRFSTESYITFRHTLNDTTNLAQALKVYALNIKYDLDKSSYLLFGRKINPMFSSMGAIDGFQYQKGWGNFSLGAILGTRPDFQNYSFNPNLLQFGAYLSLNARNTTAVTQTTLGVIEQMNTGNTDRRFIYFQHASTIAKNLNFFGSMEVDLYENIKGEIKQQAQLTNLYVSLRYRLSRNFRLNASYDNRKNIIYYESYKNFIDQLIEDETRQGFRFGFNHRINKSLSWGANAGIRYQQSKRNPARNASAYLGYNQIPFIKARLRLRASWLQTAYLESQIYGARLSKELIRGKLNAGFYYRWVDYTYTGGGRNTHQDIAGSSLTWRIQQQLSLHLFYEGVFDKNNNNYQRVNLKLIKRF